MKNLVVLVSCTWLSAAALSGEFWREAPKGVPGVVLVTSNERGETSFECVGYADRKAKRKMTPDSIFCMASANLEQPSKNPAATLSNWAIQISSGHFARHRCSSSDAEKSSYGMPTIVARHPVGRMYNEFAGPSCCGPK